MAIGYGGNRIKSLAVLGFAALLCAAANAADEVTVSSTYDEASGTWVGDVTALTNAIANAAKYQKVYLSKGVYDLSPLTNAPMYQANGKGYGAALIWANAEGVKFIGVSDNPADVLIKATDCKYRLLCLNSKFCGLYNVTMAGGNASADHIATYNYRRGGAVMLSGDSAVVSNCVFYGNNAATSGGAVGGPNSLNGTVYDSVFHSNNESEYGLAASCVTLRNCIITNNVVASATKESWTGSVADKCHVYDSCFAHNMASRTGGISEGLAVNCTFLFNAQNNPYGNNWSNPGGGGAYNSVVSNCTFYGNTSYRLGGAIRGGTVVNCTVISNATRLASDSYGGGIYNASHVEGCNVSSNISFSGGGLSHCTAFDTQILYNKAKSGGGARTSALTGCVIAHNVATDYGNGNYGGAGGGMRYGAATNCVFRDNSCSATWESSVLKGCDIADTSMHVSVIDSCVVHDVQNDAMPRAVGNVAYPDGHVCSNIYMIGGCELMRNCLVTNCTWKSIKGSYVNSAMFESGRSVITARVENCSFIDNYIYLTARNYNTPTQIISIVNSVFHSTRKGNRNDIDRLSARYMVFSNCVYGTYNANDGIEPGYEYAGCTSIVDRVKYRFDGKEPHPFELKRTSPLRGFGLVLDWMAEGTDFVGNPRLRDGAADAGCYQCWLDPAGTVMIVR